MSSLNEPAARVRWPATDRRASWATCSAGRACRDRGRDDPTGRSATSSPRPCATLDRRRSARSCASDSASTTTSRGRCRRSAIGCTSRASASGRSNRARRTSCVGRRKLRSSISTRTMPLPAVLTTPDGSRSRTTASDGSCAATAGARSVGRQRLADANIPKRYQHCTLGNFTAYNQSLERAVAQARRVRRRISPMRETAGCSSRGRRASARRTWRSPC